MADFMNRVDRKLEHDAPSRKSNPASAKPLTIRERIAQHNQQFTREGSRQAQRNILSGHKQTQAPVIQAKLEAGDADDDFGNFLDEPDTSIKQPLTNISMGGSGNEGFADTTGFTSGGLTPGQVATLLTWGLDPEALVMPESEKIKFANLLQALPTQGLVTSTDEGYTKSILDDGEAIVAVSFKPIGIDRARTTIYFKHGSNTYQYEQTHRLPSHFASSLGEKGKQPGTFLPTEPNESIYYFGQAMIQVRKDELYRSESSQAINVEGAPLEFNPQIQYYREFEISPGDGRNILIKVEGVTYISAKNKEAASLDVKGESSLKIQILVRRKDLDTGFESYEVFGAGKESTLNDLIPKCAVEGDLPTVLLQPNAPDASFLNAAVNLANRILPSLPARELADPKPTENIGGGEGKGNKYESEEEPGNEMPLDQLTRYHRAEEDTDRIRPWGSLTREERREEAWKVFKDEFSWANVLRYILIGVLIVLGVVVLIAALPELTIFGITIQVGPALIGLLGAFATVMGLYTIIAPYLQGGSPDLADWLKGGLLAIGGLVILGALILGGPELMALATNVGILAGVLYAAVEAVNSIVGVEEAAKAPTREQMHAEAREAAREGEHAVADGVLASMSGLFARVSKAIQKVIKPKASPPGGEVESIREVEETAPIEESLEIPTLVRHPNWIEVLNIRTKLLARRTHVIGIEHFQTKSWGRGFGGCHSKIGLDEYISLHPDWSYELRLPNRNPTNGVYESYPVIKSPTGEEILKIGNDHKSSFFPDHWNETQIIDEVEHAVMNNHGRDYSSHSPNEYFGFSRDGSVEIHFYLSPSGEIKSYFPKFTP